MTSLEFEAALKEPDHDSSNLRLYDLVAAGVFSDESLPLIAEKYMQAFCCTTLSHSRRRWIGVALAAMLDASPEVIGHMESVPLQLQGLGDVILNPDEHEVTRIVAGIIMRQALEKHISFPCFWRSDKVRNSATNFPRDCGPQWLYEFQQFLDTLSKLLLTKPITNPAILYPVSVVGSDGLEWSSPDKGEPILIAQAKFLTMLMPDGPQREFQFLDVPIANIKSTKTRPSAPLHNSQSLTTEHEPWDLVLTLGHDTETYHLNSRQHTATVLTIMFRTSKDAEDCGLAIEALRRPQPAQIHQPNKHRTEHTVCRSSPITIDRLQQSNASQTSSDQLGMGPFDTVQSLQRPQEHPSNENTHEGPLQLTRDTQKPWTRVQAGSAQPVEHLQPVRTYTNTNSAQETKNDSTVCVQEGMSRVTRARARTESIPSSEAVAIVRDDASSATRCTASKQPMSSAKAVRKGKLPKVSHATKKRAFQRIRKQVDTSDVPAGRDRITGEVKASPDGSSDLDLTPDAPVIQRVDTTSRACASAEKAKKMHGKSKAEDDDEFVPDATKTTSRGATKRKAVAGTIGSDKPTKKKAKTELTASTESSLGQAKTQHKARTSQRRKPKDAEMSDSYVTASRTSLIGGLLGLQNQSATKMDFKKPALPERAPQAPSTPTNRRTLPVRPQPRTPIEGRKPPKTPATSIASSPLVYTRGDEYSTGPPTSAPDTKILSSNSKPLPASPHAESTAISGHADRSEVDFEKLTGEIQTARLDPFKQRREGRKQTSFIRRLTGEELEKEQQPANAPSTSVSANMGGTLGLGARKFLSIQAASQSLPQPRGSGSKQNFVYNSAFDLRPSATTTTLQAKTVNFPERVTTPVEITEVHQQLMSDDVVSPLQSSKRKADEIENSYNLSRKKHAAQHSQVAPPPPAPQVPSVFGQEGTLDDLIQVARQEVIGNTQTPRSIDVQDHPDANDTTLVNDDLEEHLPAYRASPINFSFCSSPPMPGTPSSHSSTSHLQELSPKSPLPTSQAEEEEWEATLQPHQRALHDVLMRVSKRVLRHVVDNETAVTDIADVYENDGEHLVNELLQRQDAECKELWSDLSSKKTTLRNEMKASLKELARERRRISTLS